MTAVRSTTVVGATTLLLLLTGYAASGSPASTTGDVSASAAHDAPAAPAGGDAFGCTDAMISFMDANGYADPTLADPAGFTFPEAGAPPTVPACYVVDDFGGTARKGAIFVGDADAAIAAIGSTLSAAGYQQNSGYGAYIWWLDGEDPSSARYAVGAGPQQIDGEDVIWATWPSD